MAALCMSLIVKLNLPANFLSSIGRDLVGSRLYVSNIVNEKFSGIWRLSSTTGIFMMSKASGVSLRWLTTPACALGHAVGSWLPASSAAASAATSATYCGSSISVSRTRGRFAAGAGGAAAVGGCPPLDGAAAAGGCSPVCGGAAAGGCPPVGGAAAAGGCPPVGGGAAAGGCPSVVGAAAGGCPPVAGGGGGAAAAAAAAAAAIV